MGRGMAKLAVKVIVLPTYATSSGSFRSKSLPLPSWFMCTLSLCLCLMASATASCTWIWPIRWSLLLHSPSAHPQLCVKVVSRVRRQAWATVWIGYKTEWGVLLRLAKNQKWQGKSETRVLIYKQPHLYDRTLNIVGAYYYLHKQLNDLISKWMSK